MTPSIAHTIGPCGGACLGSTVEMAPGDDLDIPAHKKHRVAWTTPDEPTIWLAVHYGGGE